MTARNVVHNTLWNLAGQVLPLLLAIVVVPLLITRMGLSRFGFLTLAWALIGYAGLFDFGIGRAMTRVVAKYIADSDKAGAFHIARAGSSFMVTLGMLVGLALFGSSGFILNHWLTVPAELQTEALTSLRLLALSVPVVLLTAAYRGVLEAHQAFKQLAMIQLTMGVLTYLGPLTALAFSARLEVVVGTIVLMRILANYLHARVCHQSLKYVYRWKLPDRISANRLFALGGWMSVSNIVGPMMTYMDRFILGGLVTIELVAYYATPYDMITKVMVLPYAFMGALFPVLAGMSGDMGRVRKVYTTTVKILFVLMLPITFVIIALAAPAMQLWLGESFSLHGAPVLQVLAIGILANTLAQAPAYLIQSVGHPKWMAILHVIELPLFLASIWFFTLHFGLTGTAFSCAARMIVDGFVLYILAGRKLAIPNFSTSDLMLAASMSVIFLFLAFLPYSSMQRVLVCAAGVPIFAWMAWRLVLSQEDKVMFSKLIRRSATADT